MKFSDISGLRREYGRANLNRNLELTDRLREYVDREVEKFPRYLPGIEDIRVDLSATNQPGQLTSHGSSDYDPSPGTLLRAEERSGDVFAAFDAVIDKIYRRMIAIRDAG
jgi:putative sigma-54 modulation protein